MSKTNQSKREILQAMLSKKKTDLLKPISNAKVAKKPVHMPIIKKSTEISTSNTLSKLQSKMKLKLMGAQFRWINEQLYTTDSQSAVNLMNEKPELFRVYHEGFRVQVESWPLNPLSLMIQFVQKLSNSSVVVDMGCGEAELARQVKISNPCIVVHSFDLVSPNDYVVACDIKKVPLQENIADAVLFCLSLMGTNFLEFIIEARRLLKLGGTLKIAEVESRFSNLKDFIRLVENSGFKVKSKDTSHKVFYLLEFEAVAVPNTKGPLKSGDGILKPCKYRKR